MQSKPGCGAAPKAMAGAWRKKCGTSSATPLTRMRLRLDLAPKSRHCCQKPVWMQTLPNCAGTNSSRRRLSHDRSRYQCALCLDAPDSRQACHHLARSAASNLDLDNLGDHPRDSVRVADPVGGQTKIAADAGVRHGARQNGPSHCDL